MYHSEITFALVSNPRNAVSGNSSNASSMNIAFIKLKSLLVSLIYIDFNCKSRMVSSSENVMYFHHYLTHLMVD